jgi:hypothetical protein
MVAGSLITGILSLGYTEMRLHRAEDFVWSLQQGDGFKDTPSSQRVWWFHKAWLADLALDMYDAYVLEPPSNQRRIATLFSFARYGMWGGYVGYPIYALQQELLFEKDGYQVYKEYDSTEVIPDWEDYADLCGYVALSQFSGGKTAEAEEYYQKLSAMWNGSGFVDSATLQENRFLTYKNAMFLFLTKKLKQSCPFIGEVEEAIWKAWDSESGGFHPYYTNTRVYGEVHLESTCWVLIAYNRGKRLLD